MKLSIIITILFFSLQVVGQNSEDFIPRDAVTVFSINNISLLQKISMDDLVQYEFMEEVQTELFDGSTSGKTLKDSGIDFEQKLNVFYGKGADHEVSGFTFGIKNKAQLFTVFDDFDKITSKIPGIEYYSSLANHLIIKGNIGVLIRVEPLDEKILKYTDSLWYSRGNTSPWDENSDEIDVIEDENLILEEEVISQPYGSTRMTFKDGGVQVGAIKDKESYDGLVEAITKGTHIEVLESIIFSRFNKEKQEIEKKQLYPQK